MKASKIYESAIFNDSERKKSEIRKIYIQQYATDLTGKSMIIGCRAFLQGYAFAHRVLAVEMIDRSGAYMETEDEE